MRAAKVAIDKAAPAYDKLYDYLLPQDMPAGRYTLEIGITDGDTVVHLANDLPESDGFRRAVEGILIRAEENS